MPATFINHYETLEIPETASPDQVRRAFRRLAKKYHPDLHPGRQDWAQEQFRQIGQAYEILNDPQRRAAYNLEFRIQHRIGKNGQSSFSHRMRPGQSGAKEVLDLLLQEQTKEAILRYELLVERSESSEPLLALDLVDYIDCVFLLGEAYERAGRDREALVFYETVFEEESEEPQVRCYFAEIVSRLRDLYARLLKEAESIEEAVEFHSKYVRLETQNGELANIHRRMAEKLAGFGLKDEAVDYLELAFKANPNLRGARKITEQLNFSRKDDV